jgi:SAM-dependent methyltransferase
MIDIYATTLGTKKALLAQAPKPSPAARRATANHRYVVRPDIIFLPATDQEADDLVTFAKVKPGDLVYDMGCGDGQIVLAAARRGARAVGFECQRKLARTAQRRIKKEGLAHLASVELCDMLTVDLRPATVVTMHLLETVTDLLVPQLLKLRKGTRIACLYYTFDLPVREPDQKVREPGAHPMDDNYLSLWRAPLWPKRKRG